MTGTKVILIIVLLAVTYSAKASPHNRIVNGQIAHFHQFPWHLSLHITLTDSSVRYCGASLISKEFVLTAASCLRNAQSIRIDMGSVSFLNPAQTQVSTTFVSHSGYNAETNINNIGLIRLATSLTYYSNTLRAILLPGVNQGGDLHVNYEAYISGYGVFEIGSNVLSDPLRFAQKTTITNQVCQQSFNQMFVPPSTICAIGINNTQQTACFGDQGGPLVIQNKEAWMQIGIASTLHSTGCTGNHPVVYTRMTSYIEWIRQMTGIYYEL